MGESRRGHSRRLGRSGVAAASTAQVSSRERPNGNGGAEGGVGCSGGGGERWQRAGARSVSTWDVRPGALAAQTGERSVRGQSKQTVPRGGAESCKPSRKPPRQSRRRRHRCDDDGDDDYDDENRNEASGTKHLHDFAIDTHGIVDLAAATINVVVVVKIGIPSRKHTTKPD